MNIIKNGWGICTIYGVYVSSTRSIKREKEGCIVYSIYLSFDFTGTKNG